MPVRATLADDSVDERPPGVGRSPQMVAGRLTADAEKVQFWIDVLDDPGRRFDIWAVQALCACMPVRPIRQGLGGCGDNLRLESSSQTKRARTVILDMSQGTLTHDIK